MRGLMMPNDLLISDLLEHAVRSHAQQQIVSRRLDGRIVRHNLLAFAERSRQLARALLDLDVRAGDRIATLAWNTHRHLEAYYAISGIGAIVHTVNPRLFAHQIEYILQHAEDRILLVDNSFIAAVEAMLPRLPKVEHVIALSDWEDKPKGERWLCYEGLLNGQSPHFTWPRFDAQTAAALCYTSGTTGQPKGVLYSHSSTLLHAMAACRADAIGLGPESVVMPVVPMFHVCAWGVPYAALMAGARLVLPGAALDGASLSELIENERCDIALGVPTVWMGLLTHLRQQGQRLSSLRRVVIGGSAAPLAMIREFDQVHSAFVMHAWGMTEMSPLGSTNTPTPELLALPAEERYQRQLSQGREVFGLHMEIFHEDGQALPHDGLAYGHLKVRGPWVLAHYYRQADVPAAQDGWFDTGDIASIDAQGYMRIVDRAKDLIKSGGEWISSIDLENAALGFPGVREACVIGIAHPRWEERPLMLIIAESTPIDIAGLRQYLQNQVARWWLPDAILEVSELPHTATGKLSKLTLREHYADYYRDLTP